MSDHIILHNMRQRIGTNRQPRHDRDLKDLDSELQAMKIQHPYSLNREQIERLMTKDSFRQGGRGLPAEIPDQGFLYRLCNVRSVVRYTTWVSVPTVHDNDEDVWRRLKNDYDSNQEWLPLNRYAQGVLTGHRGFTWWTNLKALPDDVLSGAHTIGMPNDWIPVYAVVLRCPVSYLGPFTHVPTVLDGFSSEIFHPTIDNDNPPVGLTISLEHSHILREGSSEFVLGSLEVEPIEMRPVLIDSNMMAAHAHYVGLGPDLWRLLEVYYNRL